MEHIVKTLAGTWYTINCTDSFTVVEFIDGKPTELAARDSSGSEHFRASGTSVTITTDGKFRVFPFA